MRPPGPGLTVAPSTGAPPLGTNAAPLRPNLPPPITGGGQPPMMQGPPPMGGVAGSRPGIIRPPPTQGAPIGSSGGSGPESASDVLQALQNLFNVYSQVEPTAKVKQNTE